MAADPLLQFPIYNFLSIFWPAHLVIYYFFIYFQFYVSFYFYEQLKPTYVFLSSSIFRGVPLEDIYLVGFKDFYTFR
jgi:hypothetical protein